MKILESEGPIVVCKSRQTGVSLTLACLAVQEAYLDHHKVVIASNSEDSAKHLMRYTRDFLLGLAKIVDEQGGKLEEPWINSAALITWKSGGEIQSFAANPSTARGYPAHLVILDEFAHFEKEQNLDTEMLKAIRPSIAAVHGRMIVVSTPKGMTNEFARMWEEAKNTEYGIQVNYTDNPRLRESVKEETLPYGGTRYWVMGSPVPISEIEFMQEYGNHFDVSSDEAIPGAAIWRMLQPDNRGAWE